MAACGPCGACCPARPVFRETKLPPLDRLREHGVPMAVATDCNPGTSPLLSLRQAMQLSCTHFRLTPEESLRVQRRTRRRRLACLIAASFALACAPTSPCGASPSRRTVLLAGRYLLHASYAGGHRLA